MAPTIILNYVGFRLWGRTESDMTEVTQQQQRQPGSKMVSDDPSPLGSHTFVHPPTPH